MKSNLILIRLVPLIFAVLLAGYAEGQETSPCKEGGQTSYFAVEINGMLCGYSVETSCNGVFNGKPVRYENADVLIKMSLLGSDVDISIKFRYSIDPSDDRVLMAELISSTGQSEVHSVTRAGNDTLFYSDKTSGTEKAIPFRDNYIFFSQTKYPHLLKDLRNTGIAGKKYTVYDPVKGELVEKVYTRKGEEKISLADTSFNAILFEENDLSTGIITKLWLARDDGFNLRMSYAGRDIYLAEKSVISRIKMADMSNVLIARVNKIIPDFLSIGGLKVKARINSYGENITPESLNVPGQKFTGTVTGSLIDGIFETNPVNYAGKDSPPYPSDFRKRGDLIKYISPEQLIESDNPKIMAEAGTIASGSKNSWEAAVRLSKWVAEKITYAIPGGGSAINTLMSGEAECGGHSRLLAAFCRAVGIPARLSVGCVYTSSYGGSFGQHAWTEIYMGEAGWIPVDATFNQHSFIDAGHIRLGERTSFQPVSIEIIDYKAGRRDEAGPEADSVPEAYKLLIGPYTDMNDFRVFRVLYNDNALSVDIPGQMVVPLYNPDEKGQWYPKISRLLSFSFVKSSEGSIGEMTLSQYAPMKKMSKPDSIPGDIAPEYRKYIGNYLFQQAKLSLDVSFSENVMTMQDPLRRTKELLRLTHKGDCWIDEAGIVEVRFESDVNDEVIRMNLTAKKHLRRGESVISALTPVIQNEGIEAGIKKYREIKIENTGEFILTDLLLNRLGHQLISNGKTDYAIQIFRLAVEEYPDSFEVNDSLAETYLKIGEKKLALKYFEKAVKLMPDYEYGRKKIEELKDKR